jgi:hypothetical protein
VDAGKVFHATTQVRKHESVISSINSCHLKVTDFQMRADAGQPQHGQSGFKETTARCCKRSAACEQVPSHQ